MITHETNEKIHEMIVQIMDENSCSMWDACLEFCVRHTIDPEDLVLLMDDVTKSRLKMCAVEENMIRKEERQGFPLELPLK